MTVIRNVCRSQLGIILVHDLTNRKSQQNLQKWLEEVLSKDGTFSKSKSFEDFDPEKFVGSTQVTKNFSKLGYINAKHKHEQITFYF